MRDPPIRGHVADNLGVSTTSQIPTVALLLTIVCALAAVNLIAYFPARAAAQTKPAVAPFGMTGHAPANHVATAPDCLLWRSYAGLAIAYSAPPAENSIVPDAEPPA